MKLDLRTSLRKLAVLTIALILPVKTLIGQNQTQIALRPGDKYRHLNLRTKLAKRKLSIPAKDRMACS
jgi:hypothetical protein